MHIEPNQKGNRRALYTFESSSLLWLTEHTCSPRRYWEQTTEPLSVTYMNHAHAASHTVFAIRESTNSIVIIIIIIEIFIVIIGIFGGTQRSSTIAGGCFSTRVCINLSPTFYPCDTIYDNAVYTVNCA